MIALPFSIPEPHRRFLEGVERLKSDDRIMGIAVGGSLLEASVDIYRLLRKNWGEKEKIGMAESRSMEYLEKIERGFN